MCAVYKAKKKAKKNFNSKSIYTEYCNLKVFNVKAHNTAKRANNELKQGVGKWYFTYASKNVNAIINSECIYSIRYYKDNFLTLAKCEIPDKAFEQIKNISK